MRVRFSLIMILSLAFGLPNLNSANAGGVFVECGFGLEDYAGERSVEVKTSSSYGIDFEWTITTYTLPDGRSFVFDQDRPRMKGDDRYLGSDGEFYEYGDWSICVPREWIWESSDDGFVKQGSISIFSDPGSVMLQIFCSKKKFEVFVREDYPDGYGWQGSGQVKFDSGKISTLKYTVGRTFSGFYANEPVNFIKALAKSKSKVSLKFNTIDGPVVAVFPRANFLDYKSKFAKMGCKY